MNDYILTNIEIKNILKKIPKVHHLQAYKTLKNTKFSGEVTKKELKEFEKDVVSIFKKEDLPRLLKESELDEIVDVIPLSPATLKDISEDINLQIKTVLRRQLSKLKVSVKEDTIEIIKNNILEKFYRSSSQAGDSAGVLACMSIGQPLIQGNLNTFHNSGKKNSSEEGISYVKKLLNLSENKKSAVFDNIIHFKDKNKTREEIIDIGKKLKGISIEDLLIVDGKKLMKKIPAEDKFWYANYIKIMDIDLDIIKDNCFLRISLDITKLYKYDILLSDIVNVIKRNSRAIGFKSTVECIASNSYKGLIDIYTSKEFARKNYEDFSSKINRNSNLTLISINDQIKIFLKKIFANNLKNMFLKGIKGITAFEISEPLNVLETFTEISIINERDLIKFSKAPYNLKLEDIDYLWYIRITRYYIYYIGLNEDKYIKLFEEAGLKIIENNFKSENPHFIALVPKKRDVKYFDDETGKSYTRYTMKGERYYDNKDEVFSNIYNPKKLINEKLEYTISSVMYNIEKKLKSNNIKDVNLEFEPIYRYANYYHGVAEGSNIISELYSIDQIDFSFSYPDNVREIYRIFGIEAARFHLSSKYNSGQTMKNVNPVNIEMLIDFQTSYGYPLSVSNPSLAKQGNSILTAASFEASLDHIYKGSAFGEVDEIKGISSSIITGSRSKNGTGIVKCQYSTEYLENKDNMMPDNYEDDDRDIAEDSDVIGPCYKTAKLDNILDDIDADTSVYDEKDLKPPRMKIDLDLEDIILSSEDENLTEKNANDDIFKGLDIPDAPETYQGDLL